MFPFIESGRAPWALGLGAIRRRATPLIATLALGACGDRSVSPIVEPTPPDGPTSCDETWADYEPVDEIVSCGIEPGWSEPRLRWYLPGYTAIGAGPLIDTDGDGRVTIHDESMIFARSRDDDGRPLRVIDGRGVVRAEHADLGGSAYFDPDDGSGYAIYGSRSTNGYDRLIAWRPDRGEIVTSANTTRSPGPYSSSLVGRLAVGAPILIVSPMAWIGTLDGTWLRDSLHSEAWGASARPVLYDRSGHGLTEIVLGAAILSPDLDVMCERDHYLRDLAVVDLRGDRRALTVGIVQSEPTEASGPVQSGDVYVYDRCERRERLYRGTGSVRAHRIAIGDLTGDGRSEIVVSDHSFGFVAVRPDGSTLWRRPGYDHFGHKSSILADLDGDGALEVVTGTGLILDGATGETLADLTEPTAEREGDLPQRSGSGSMVVDLEGDGHAEIVVTGLDGIYLFEGERGWAAGPRCGWRDDHLHVETLDDDCRIPDGPPGPAALRTTFRVARPWPGAPRAGGELAIRFADVCEAECAEGRLRAIVQVGNLGTVDIDQPVEVRLTGETASGRILLGSQVLPFAPAATWLPGITFEVAVDGPLDDLTADVAPLGWRLHQCDPSDDVVSLGHRICRGAP